MALWQALVLGLIEGFTEFIPISSTGHLTIAGRLMHLIDNQNPESWTAFVAVLQLGTLAALLTYFGRDIFGISRSFVVANAARVRGQTVQPDDRHKAFLGWLVILGSIPVAVVGLALRNVIEGEATKDLRIIAGAVIGMALLLLIAERVATRRRDMQSLKWSDAIIVGIAQCISLIPGSSRSGTTITAGLFAGLTRDAAARFSFLLCIPAILASGLLQLPKALNNVDIPVGTLLLAVVVAGVSGYFAIAFLLRFLQTRSTHLFIVYRLALGLTIIGLLLSGTVQN